MNRIKQMRQANGWTQEDLAGRLSVSYQAVGHYEREFRSLDVETIHKLCDIFGCTADYLLGRSEVETFELTPDEAGLLRGYRALSEPGKEYVRHTLALAALAHTGKNGALSDLAAD